MAEAVVEERQLLKSLRWWDGFTIGLCQPGFLLGSLLAAYGSLGVIGATVLWGIAALVALLSVWIYSEPAMMFPGRSGGISLYANEGWRKYTTLVGPVATFGYWIGWSVVLAIFGNLIGSLIQAQWFSSTNWDVYDGVVHLNLFNFIGIGCIILVWLFNVFGVRPFQWFTYVTGVLMMIPLAVLMIGPFVSGNWHSSNVHWALASTQWGGVKIALVWLFIMTWSAGGVEVCATFTPEYKTRRDSTIALRSTATFSLLVYILLPLGLGGYYRDPLDVGDPCQLDVRDCAEHDRRPRRHGCPAHLPDPLVPAVDGDLNRRRRARAVRDLAGGTDDQTARGAQPLPRPRPRDDRRPGRQHVPDSVHLQQPGDPLHEQHRLRACATCSR